MSGRHRILRNLLNSMRAGKSSLVPVTRNLRHALTLKPFSEERVDEFIISPLKHDKLAAAEKVYARINEGKPLSLTNRLLMRLLGSRLCAALYDPTGDLVGISLYYFNKRDVHENSIHEAFIGLIEKQRGKKLGTAMRRHALNHFAATPIKAVSSRVSRDNVASLNSNLKLGFRPAEEYFDEKLGEHRYYLVCDLDRYR